MTKKHAHVYLRLGTIRRQTIPTPDPPAPPQPAPDDAVAKAQFEAEKARAEAAKLAQKLAEIQSQLPTEEQRARYAELEAKAQQDEEARKRKEGEFDAWRRQLEEKSQTALENERNNTANARALAEQADRELDDTLIGLAFSGAVEWFGPAGKTVMLPDVAKAYFGAQVMVDKVPGLNGGPASRRVVVKDANGTVILDTKTGKPAPFAQAIGEVIESHPQKAHLLRGSNRVGSGSAGGDQGIEGIHLGRLKPEDFRRSDVRAMVRDQQRQSGGLQVGSAFDRIEQAKRERGGK